MNGSGEEQAIKSNCRGCHGGCGVLAYIEDGKLFKIEGDPDHPWNQGRLCARCLAMTQYVYHPDRLTRPLKRVGERGRTDSVRTLFRPRQRHCRYH